MLTGRQLPGPRVLLMPGPAKAAEIFVGIAKSAPILKSIRITPMADLPAADMPAPCIGPAGQLPIKEHGNGPDARKPGYGDAGPSEQRPKFKRAGGRFALAEFALSGAVRKRSAGKRSSLPFRRTSGQTAPPGHPKDETAPENSVAQGPRLPGFSLECTQG